MVLSKSVNYFVNTVCYDSIAKGAFNANDGEAIQSTLPYRAAKICLLVSEVSEVSTLKHNGVKVWCELQQMPAINRSAAVQFKCFKINRKDFFQNKDCNIF